MHVVHLKSDSNAGALVVAPNDQESSPPGAMALGTVVLQLGPKVQPTEDE